MKFPLTHFSRPGLSLPAFDAVLEKLGQPHLSVPTILVGGTNGKGTTATSLAALLKASGRRVGLFLSPHIQNERERISVDGKRIPEPALTALEVALAKRVEVSRLNFFQYWTTLAHLYFQTAEVDVAVLEVGIGGRFDPTNRGMPQLSIITSIGLDHMDKLGTDEATILGEKLPIARKGRPLIFSALQSDLLTLAKRWCDQQDVELKYLGRDFELLHQNAHGQFSGFGKSAISLSSRATSLSVAINRSTALAGFLMLSEKNTLSDSQILTTLDSVQLPARLQQVRNFIIDMAHNDPALSQLSENIPQPFNLIIAQPANRQWKNGLQLLVSQAQRTICPQMLSEQQPDDYFLPAAHLQSSLRNHGHETQLASSLTSALELVDNAPTLICGSARLAGQALTLLGVDTTQTPLYR